MRISGYTELQHAELQFANQAKPNQITHMKDSALEDNGISKTDIGKMKQRADIYQRSINLKKVQSNVSAAFDAESYFAKFNRILERFREFGREIVEKTLSIDDLDPSILSEKSVKELKSDIRSLNQDLSLISKNRPWFKGQLDKVENLQNRFLGKRNLNFQEWFDSVDNIYTEVEQKRMEYQNYLDDFVADYYTESQDNIETELVPFVTSMKDSYYPSATHDYLKSDKALQLIIQ